MEQNRATFTASILVVLVTSSAPIYAEYCATDKIEGNVCSGIGIEVCDTVSVDAVHGESGELYTVNRCYESVSDYDESMGRCWIKTKSTGWGPISWLLNMITQPKFYHLTPEGDYEEVDIEYLTFECARQ